jgi:hypothetical protein
MRICLTGHNAWVPLVKGTPTSIAERFQSHGIEVTKTATGSMGCVSVDFDKLILKTNEESLISRESLILVRLEPDVVWPSNYSKEVSKRFGLVIDVGRNPMNNSTAIPWPQDWNMLNHYSNSEKIMHNQVAIVCGNKLSFITGELYSLRRKCINKIDSIELYGTNWDVSFLRKIKIFLGELLIATKNRKLPRLFNARLWFFNDFNWQGSPESKLDELSKFRMTLVIENSIDYMTEKLFDAFLSRSIPIYVGPPVSDYGIPTDLVIQARPEIKSIKDAIEIASKMDFDTWKYSLEEWLNLDSTREKWSQEAVHDEIVEMTVNFLKLNHAN